MILYLNIFIYFIKMCFICPFKLKYVHFNLKYLDGFLGVHINVQNDHFIGWQELLVPFEVPFSDNFSSFFV